MAGRPPGAGARPGDRGEASWEDRSDELMLLDEDDRLPWLDSSDDAAPARRPDIGRLAGYGLTALALAGAVGAAGWWLTSRTADLQPEGTVIAAPAEPYRVRPVDSGGKQHAGTGDTSFAVGEGQRREARIAEAAPPPVPLATAAASPPVDATREPDDADSPSVPGVGVQVGAYYNNAAAERGWATLIRQTEALQGVPHRVVRGTADIGTVYRLQAVAPDAAAAQRLCDALRADGLTCQVKR